jgi:phage terminase large subunit
VQRLKINKYSPRIYQKKILSALNNGIKRAIWVVHRRGGKDITIFNWCIYKLLLEKSTCFYILPTYAQAKKVIWDSITIEGIRFLDFIPQEIIESKNKQEMKIIFNNGSVLQLIGSDNIDSLVGTNPKIIVFSEYAIQSPQAWDFLAPILRVNGGIAIFISTPRGKNHFYDLFTTNQNNPKWFTEILTINDTKVLSKIDMEEEKSSGMSDEMIQQEYYCSFSRGVEGSYYGRIIEQARLERRICNVPYNPNSPVHTAWDLGWRDSTSITFWQDVGGECRIIDHYEAKGEKMDHYVRILKDKSYLYGTHYLPHDAASEDAKSRSYQDILYDLGIKTTCLTRETDISPGIESVRVLLSWCYIDEFKCKYLLKCLENYHKKYNEKTKCYSDSPLHDWTSHSADSIRYMARARIEYGRGVSSMTPEKLQKIKANAGYGPKPRPNPLIGPHNQPFGR